MDLKHSELIVELEKLFVSTLGNSDLGNSEQITKLGEFVAQHFGQVLGALRYFPITDQELNMIRNNYVILRWLSVKEHDYEEAEKAKKRSDEIDEFLAIKEKLYESRINITPYSNCG